MKTHMTIDQLEQMKTHELADLLSNVVLLLRRMPDVECKQLVQQVSSPDNGQVEPRKPTQVPTPKSSFTQKELSEMTVPQLKALAKELNVLFPATIKKSDLIEKIVARPADGHSEQRAIRDI